MTDSRMLLIVLIAAVVCAMSVGVGAAEEVNLELIGHCDITSAEDVAISGDYAYVANHENGLVIVDINTKSAPVLAGSYSTTGNAWGVAVSGNYAYVAYGSNGLVIIDVSDPMAPTFAGSYDTEGYAGSVAIAGSYAYVADWYNGFVIVDISDPTSLTLAGSYDTAVYAWDIAVPGYYAYVADNEGGLVVVDISNPTAPTLAGSYDTAGKGYGVAIADNYAYVVDDVNGLVIIDISDPAVPTFAGSYATAGEAIHDVAISGSYAYVADDWYGLLVVDISDPTAPTLAGSYDTTGYAQGVAVSGSYAYVADYSGGLVILRTDASGTDPTPSAATVHIRSSQDFMERKYVANGSFSSSPSDLTCRVRLEILADSGQFVVPKVVIFNTSSVNLDRIYYQVDEVSLGRGNIVVFPDRIEWTGNNETVSSEFELGIYELNTHQLTPPFSSSRSVEKEVFDGNGTVKMTFNATPTDNLDYLEITVFAEETDHADSILLEETATNEGFIDESCPEKIRWEFDDSVIGHTYSASVNMTVTPKTDSATRYWAYTIIEGGYGSYTNSTSGSDQSMVEYTDSILGDLKIYFESPVDYCSTDADGEEYYERFKHFSEIVEDGEPHTIGIGDNAYEPGVRTVPAGTTVTWTNWEELVHTVTSDTGLWDSGNLSDGQSFSYTFTTPGTYTYHDALHPSVTGVVIVMDTTSLNIDIYVNPTGWWRGGGAFNASSTPIQAAVGGATEGEAIFVYNGSYDESIAINKAISLIGENKNNTVIDGDGNEAISIYSNNVEVSNFTLQNGGGGITAKNSAGGKIFNNIIRYNTGGIGLETSNNFMIFDNYVYNNSQAGIGVWDGSYDSVICNNTIIQNGYEGIGVGETSYNITIFDNYVFNNTNTGIGLWDTSNLTVVYNNTLINNSNANIAIGDLSFSNIIYHNNFISNLTNARDYNGTNTWDNGYPSGGNYWSDYTGTDTDGDGIGDTPYNIDGGAGAQDRYPLMQPWNGSDITPPNLTITTPTNGTTVTTSLITVTGTASDESGIANVTVNGILAAGTTSWSAEVTLTEGVNTITVVATDNAGNTASDTITITYTPATSLKGDLDHDGALTPTDAAIALEIAAGSREYDAAADVSGDGRVTSLDALMILQAGTAAGADMIVERA